MSNDTPIEAADLATRTRAALRLAGIRTLAQAAAMSDKALLALPNFSRACLVDLQGCLDERPPPRPLGGGGGALDRARGPVEGDDPLEAAYREVEFYPSPPWAGRAGGELLRELDPGSWSLLEPACGQGHLAYGLADYFASIDAADVFPHGFGRIDDFLRPRRVGSGVDWIVTNPPFKASAEFVREGLRQARRGVAILQKLTFLETVDRFDLMHGAKPLTVLAQFAERVPMQLGLWDPKGSTATPYAWFVWLQPDVASLSADPLIRAANRNRQFIGRGIPPGTRARLSRPRDAVVYGGRLPVSPKLQHLIGGAGQAAKSA